MKKLISLVAALAGAMLAGCSGLTNLTPENVAENSSRTYTISMSAHINDGSVIQDSIRPYIVIDGEIIPMRKAEDMKHDRIYEYDYSMPKNRKEAKYYFLLDYDVENSIDGVSKHRQMTSRTVYVLRPISRYVISMQNERGPVGTVVPVLGRGFDKLDRVIIGDVYADSEFISRTTLNFVVPPLQSGRNYDVSLINTKGDEIWIGQFRVDASNMNVSPASIDITGGDLVTMIFNIGFEAPKGGYPIDVKTNIPSSIIMDEIVVPEGKRSVTATLKGAAAGKGFLYINGLGFTEKVIPVEVRENNELLSVANDAARKVDQSAEKEDAAKQATGEKVKSDGESSQNAAAAAKPVKPEGAKAEVKADAKDKPQPNLESAAPAGASGAAKSTQESSANAGANTNVLKSVSDAARKVDEAAAKQDLKEPSSGTEVKGVQEAPKASAPSSDEPVVEPINKTN